MRKILALFLVLTMALGFVSCATPEQSIVGEWKCQESILGVVTETKYTFNEDGTGTKSAVVDVDFTYSFTEDKLIITTSVLGVESKDEYFFKFSGKKLELTGKDKTINLEKVN